MGILHFFKNRKKIEKIELEDIEFKEMEDWLNKKEKVLIKEEKEVFTSIEEKIKLFAEAIGRKISVLREIDIESKKVEGRVKIIVKQGLDKYIYFVEVFVKDLETIEKQNLEQFFRDTNKVFATFDKHSHIFYERANYLIGDEIAETKQEIKDFSKYFSELFNKNKNIINSLGVISSVRSQLEQLKKIETTEKEINLEIKNLEEEAERINKKEVENLDEIEKIKTTNDYKKNKERIEKINLLNKQVEKEILKLKTFVDFKKLSNFFHSNENKMDAVKKYKENFQENFTKDNGEELLVLVGEAKLDSKSLLEEMKKITKIKNKIEENKELIERDKVKKLTEEIRDLKSELENVHNSKKMYSKRNGSIKENRAKIIDSIKPNIIKLGGSLLAN